MDRRRVERLTALFQQLGIAGDVNQVQQLFDAFGVSYDEYTHGKQMWNFQNLPTDNTMAEVGRLVFEYDPLKARNLAITQRNPFSSLYGIPIPQPTNPNFRPTGLQYLGPLLDVNHRIRNNIALDQANMLKLKRGRRFFQNTGDNGQRKIPCRVFSAECQEACDRSMDFPDRDQLIYIRDTPDPALNQLHRCQLITAVAHNEDIALFTDTQSVIFAMAHLDVVKEKLYEIIIYRGRAPKPSELVEQPNRYDFRHKTELFEVHASAYRGDPRECRPVRKTMLRVFQDSYSVEARTF